jgi:hypothetical protein
MGSDLLKLDQSDNVALAATRLPAGAELVIDGRSLLVQEDVAVGHKIALADLETGASVVKYGHTIGTVTRSVGRGGRSRGPLGEATGSTHTT